MGMGFRPTHEVQLACTSRDVLERVGAHFATTPLVVRRTRVPGGGPEHGGPRETDHVVVTIPERERHFWSPWMTIEVAPANPGAELVAKFSPHPSVWTAFMFGYLALGSIAAVAVTVGASALALGGGQRWAWWTAGGASLAMLGMWIASQLGQRLAGAQMTVLRTELERGIDACR